MPKKKLLSCVVYVILLLKKKKDKRETNLTLTATTFLSSAITRPYKEKGHTAL